MTVDSHSKHFRVLKLKCKVQNYEWGRFGSQSEVGRLYALQAGVPLAEDKPFAELWMGTHDSGPSLVVLDEKEDRTMLLKDWLSQNPHSVGEKASQFWGADLPFLFKVLSVGKALSIQAHPDKKLAKQLHQLHPEIYKDANHKPEMALAISHFEALCGFMSPQEIKEAIREVPELQSVLGETVVKALLNVSRSKDLAKVPLRAAFTSLMSANDVVVRDAVGKIIARLSQKEQVSGLTSKEQLVIRLANQYPGDVGVLSSFFLNYVCLAPGEALYLDANEPHAYIAGDCVECMATSDNVVRAGLTPKYKDTQTLCAMLSYKQGRPVTLAGVQINSHTKRYSPPLEEFEVDVSILEHGESVVFPAFLGPSVMLVLEGEGTMQQRHGKESSTSTLRKGDVYFVPAGIQLAVLSSTPSRTTDYFLRLYRAGISSAFLRTDLNVHVC